MREYLVKFSNDRQYNLLSFQEYCSGSWPVLNMLDVFGLIKQANINRFNYMVFGKMAKLICFPPL